MTPDEIVQQLTSSYAVVIFSKSDCCMSVMVKHLIFTLGAGPKVVELDEHVNGSGIQDVLYNKLVPHLKEAGALWL
ncbi:Thioredoxin-like superfamily [Sesbania bispinosa]|nr:Thioredoxin-like superfamily [Sesbania bispinosa]